MTKKQKDSHMIISWCLILGFAALIYGLASGRIRIERKSNCSSFHPVGAEIGILAKPAVADQSPNLLDLLAAIEYVESNGDPDAIGDNGAAVGCLQIHKIMVQDVNRILRKRGYTFAGCYDYNDRYSRSQSYAMAEIYFDHYCEGEDFEHMARCWNGGPSGYQKESTKAYWEKVKARLN